MAVNSTITLDAIINTAGGTRELTYSVSIPNTVGVPQSVTLASGNTTLNFTSGTKALLALIPAQTGIITLKGVAGDTGFTLVNNNANPVFMALPVGGTSAVVTATVSVPGVEVWFV